MMAGNETSSQFLISNLACLVVKRVGHPSAIWNIPLRWIKRLHGTGGVMTNSPTDTSLSRIRATNRLAHDWKSSIAIWVYYLSHQLIPHSLALARGGK